MNKSVEESIEAFRTLMIFQSKYVNIPPSVRDLIIEGVARELKNAYNAGLIDGAAK